MAAEAFAALNRILESRERRESDSRQYALALMQFDYQREQAQMAQTGKQLELLQGANAQMMTNVASDFMSSSGLDVLYSDDPKATKNAVDDLKDIGLSEGDASRVTSAVWAYYTAQNPQPILRLGKSLKDIVLQGDAATLSQRNLVKGLGGRLGLTSASPLEVDRAKSLLDRTEKILQNQDDFMSEVYEYGTGDFDIQRTDIGLGLQQLSEEREQELDEDPSIISVPTPEEMLGQSKQSVKIAESDFEETQNALNLLDTESMSLRELQRRGALTDEQREYLSRIPKIKEDLQSELADLNEAINKAKEELGESRGFEAQVKLSRIMEAKRKSTGGHYSPY